MALSSVRSGRVAKRATSSTTIPSSSNKSSSSKGEAVLQKMVDEATTGIAGSSRQSHTHEDDTTMSDCDWEIVEDSWQSRGSNNGQCPILDGDTKPFALMLLPAEIRNEIYRACLTRPFNVLLSKRDPPPPPDVKPNEDEEDGVASDFEDSGEEITDEDDAGASVSRAFPPSLPLTPATNTAQATAGSSRPWPLRLSSWASRSGRSSRYFAASSSLSSSVGANAGLLRNASTMAGAASRPIAARPVRVMSRQNTDTQRRTETPKKPRPQDADPLLINLLRCNKQIYQEARAILYSENLFTLDLDNALPTLAALHQRSRRQIKHVEVEIPSYNEILERFQETVRLSLRYCWGLRKFVIHMPFTLPGADGSGTTGNTTVYANGFDILRWLPKQCEVELQGIVASEIEAVVAKNANLARTLDELAYARRQLISNEEPTQSQQQTSS